LDVVAMTREDLRHIGQIIFARSFVGLNFVDMPPQNPGTEAVDAGIDHANRELLLRAGFLLDNRANVALFIEKHTSVSGRVRESRGVESGSGIRACLRIPQ